MVSLVRMVSLVKMVSLVRIISSIRISYVRMVKLHLGLNVSSSTHDCRCMVGGSGAMVAIQV